MKLFEQFEIVARRRRLAQNTIDAYATWIRQFLSFSASNANEWKHPKDLGSADVEAFLNDLVIRRRLSASAQNQALCALVFLYTHVLQDVIPQDSSSESFFCSAAVDELSVFQLCSRRMKFDA